MANAITAARIILGILLLFLPFPSRAFFAIYILAGVSDMIDGPVARRTHTESNTGSVLDTVSDICFFMCAACKILPEIHLPVPLIVWTGAIAAVKIASYTYSVIKKYPLPHSILNKAAGVLLFVFPLTFYLTDPVIPAAVISAVASLAALEELRCCVVRR